MKKVLDFYENICYNTSVLKQGESSGVPGTISPDQNARKNA